MQFPTDAALLGELFGPSSHSCPIDFPSHLNYFVSKLPHGHTLTADQLIKRHTLYPYYAPFLPLARAARLKEEMKSGEGQARFRRLMATRRISVAVSEYLRYCPNCVTEDRRQLGECYWHRVHQIPGVDVCPIHEMWLESSSISAWGPFGTQGMVTAEHAIVITTPRWLEAHEPGREGLLTLARNAAWLLHHPQPAAELATWSARYRFLLAERGWGTYRKRLAWGPFWQAFLHVYPLAVLQRLDGHAGSLSTGRGIRALLGSHTRAIPPLYHLLLIHFLGLTAEQLFALPRTPEVFGTGPWPCLNPVAPHVNERAVVRCDVQTRRQDGRPIGTFSCACGFVYRREGPDWGPLAAYRYDTIERYGLYWEWALRKLWRDPHMRRETIAERLGVSRVTVWEQARRLGLGSKRMKRPELFRCEHRSSGKSLDIQAKRTQWQRLMGSRHRTAAQERVYRQLYVWLFRWDPVWLRDQRAARRQPHTRRVSSPRLDWSVRDRNLAQAVTQAAAQLLAADTPPRWLSKHRLIAASGHGRWIWPNWDRLPRTRAAVAAVGESRAAFRMRQQRWHAQQAERGPCSKTELTLQETFGTRSRDCGRSVSGQMDMFE